MTEPIEQPAPDTTAEVGEARLERHLRLPGAVALAITIVVGSGALVLPGIAYQEVGDAAIYAWVLAAIVTVPLLAIFAWLGGHHPGAGGVAGFVQAAFGRHLAAGVEVILLGTFGLGIPAIALTGGNYLAALPGFGAVPSWLSAIGLLVAAGAVTATGLRLSTRVQIALALALSAGLVAVGVAGVVAGSPATPLPAPELGTIATAFGAVGVVFFAFTGWEMVAFTTEEYANPSRDFPRVVAISFVLVVGMYLLLASSVQLQLSPTEPATVSAPVQAVVAEVATPALAWSVSFLGVVIIAANLIGATWAASRLVMSSSREGLLPRALGHVSTRGGTPRVAVLACTAGFSVVALASRAELLSLGELLEVAGQNFFILYLMAGMAYVRLLPGKHRIFGTVVTLILAGIALTFGVAQLAYVAALLCLGVGLSVLRRRSHP